MARSPRSANTCGRATTIQTSGSLSLQVSAVSSAREPTCGRGLQRMSPARTFPARAARTKARMPRVSILSRLHQASPGHLADPQADDRDDQWPGRRIGHGHGPALRHSNGLRENAIRRLSQRRTDHRERWLVLSAEDGRAGTRPGVCLHRRTGCRARPSPGAHQSPGSVGSARGSDAGVVPPDHRRSPPRCNGLASGSCARRSTVRWRPRRS